MSLKLEWLLHPYVHAARFLETRQQPILYRKTLDQLKTFQSGERIGKCVSTGDYLRGILKYANDNCPYYTTLFRSMAWDTSDVSRFDEVPTLDKAKIRENYQALISRRIKFFHSGVMNTGGSTGQPLEFLSCSRMGIVLSAHQRFWFEKMGYCEGDRIACFSGSSVPQRLLDEEIYWVSREPPSELPYGSIVYSSLYMTPETIPSYISHLKKAEYSFFLGYPSALSEIARYCLDHGVKFAHPIKSVQITAEMANEEQIGLISEAFKTKVYGQYGHSEACIYGHTEAGKLEYQCSPFTGKVEVLDDSGKQVAVGKEGEVVVTGFWNYAMPFIRYRTGDTAVFGGVKNGAVILERLLGRTQDWLFRKDGSRIPVTAIVFGQHFKAFKSITAWQIVQNEPGNITVLVVPTPQFFKDDELEIISKFSQIASIIAVVEYVESIPLTARGKRRFVVQNLGS